MKGLPQMLAASEPLDDGFVVEIPATWLQGRTAYGGFTSAIALAAAHRVCPDRLPLRSAQLAMIAPLSGRVEA